MLSASPWVSQPPQSLPRRLCFNSNSDYSSTVVTNFACLARMFQSVSLHHWHQMNYKTAQFTVAAKIWPKKEVEVVCHCSAQEVHLLLQQNISAAGVHHATFAQSLPGWQGEYWERGT